jgi:hypothetical protein
VRTCTCPPAAVTRYARRVSGPILDRIDLYVEVPRVEYEQLAAADAGEPSAAVAARVVAARARQSARLAGAGLVVNAEMGPAGVEQHCQLDGEGQALLRRATSQLGLTARGYHRVLTVARTIADPAGSEPVELTHRREALQHRARGSIARVKAWHGAAHRARPEMLPTECTPAEDGVQLRRGIRVSCDVTLAHDGLQPWRQTSASVRRGLSIGGRPGRPALADADGTARVGRRASVLDRCPGHATGCPPPGVPT